MLKSKLALSVICSFLNCSALARKIKVEEPEITHFQKMKTSISEKAMLNLEKAGLSLHQPQEFKITAFKFIDPSIVSLSLIHIDDYQTISKKKYGNQQDPLNRGVDVNFDISDWPEKDLTMFGAQVDGDINTSASEKGVNVGANGYAEVNLFGNTVNVGPSYGWNAEVDGDAYDDGTVGMKVDLGVASFGAKVGCRTEACVVNCISIDFC